MSRASKVVSLLFVVYVAAISVSRFASPRLNWDALGYVGVIESRSTEDPVEIHQRAYGVLESHASVDQFERLTEPTEYRRQCFADPESFRQQLMYYSIRPLYWGLAAGLSSILDPFGVDTFVATYLISTISYALLCLACFLFLRSRTSPIFAGLAAIGLSLYWPLFTKVSSSIPDILLAVFVLISFWLFLERRVVWAALVLFVAVFVRTDIAIYNLIFGTLLLFRDLPRKSKVAAIALLGVSAVAASGVHNYFGYYGWATIFHVSMIEHLAYPAKAVISISPETYFAVLGEYTLKTLSRPWIWGSAAAVAAYVILRRTRPWRLLPLTRLPRMLQAARAEEIALLTIGLYFGARQLIFPMSFARFYLGQSLAVYLVTLVAVYEVVVAGSRRPASAPKA